MAGLQPSKVVWGRWITAMLAWPVCAALMLTAARADGYYLSVDYSRTQPMAVLSVDRGAWTMASAVGRGTDDLLWTKSAMLRNWRVGALRLKLGPSFYLKEWPAWRFNNPATAPVSRYEQRIGLRLGADSYVDRGPWSSFWMVEYDSTQKSVLALASADLKDSGLGAELSIWREAGEKPAPTLLARWKMPGVKQADVSLRAGWRFKDREAFVGVSVARFR